MNVNTSFSASLKLSLICSALMSAAPHLFALFNPGNTPFTGCAEYEKSFQQGDGLIPDAVDVTRIYEVGGQVHFNCWAYIWKEDENGERYKWGIGVNGGALIDTVIKNPFEDPRTPPDCSTGSAGNPIRLNDGAKYESATDITFKSAKNLSWSRFYDSTLGGWQFPYLFLSGDTQGESQVGGQMSVRTSTEYDWEWKTITLAPGITVNYGAGVAVESIFRESNLDIKLDEDGIMVSTKFRDTEDREYFYDANSALTKIIDFKNAVTLNFLDDQGLPGNLRTVKDNFGNSLTLTYNAANNLTFVEASNGEVVHYVYDSHRRLSKAGKGKDKNLAPDGFHYTTYLYEDARHPQALTGIIDEAGNRYASWTYDDEGRAVSSYHGDNKNLTTVEYTPLSDGTPKVTATNPLGKKTTYHYRNTKRGYLVSYIEGHPTSHCAQTAQHRFYDTNGYLEETRDRAGRETRYLFNDRGLEISRIEAHQTPEQRSIHTEWHPTFDLKTKIIEPGRTTRFTYDSNGNLLNKTIIATP